MNSADASLETNAPLNKWVRPQEHLLLHTSYNLVGFNNLLESIITINIIFYI